MESCKFKIAEIDGCIQILAVFCSICDELLHIIFLGCPLMIAHVNFHLLVVWGYKVHLRIRILS